MSTTTSNDADGAPALSDELIDSLLAEAGGPGKVTGADGLLAQLTKRLVERAMSAELDEDLGYEKGDLQGRLTGNVRNGTTPRRCTPSTVRCKSTARVIG